VSGDSWRWNDPMEDRSGPPERHGPAGGGPAPLTGLPLTSVRTSCVPKDRGRWTKCVGKME
jgi:hypothetical protein